MKWNNTIYKHHNNILVFSCIVPTNSHIHLSNLHVVRCSWSTAWVKYRYYCCEVAVTWTFVADMPPTECRLSLFLSPTDRESWVEFNSPGLSAIFSASISMRSMRCRRSVLSMWMPSAADADIPASTLTRDCYIASPNSNWFKVTDVEESCYDHEVEGQSFPDNNSKLIMDTILGNTPVFTTRLFANIKIKELRRMHGKKSCSLW